MKRFNNKILIITFLVLIGAFVLTRVFRSPGLERNLSKDIFSVDTAKITTLKIYPTAEQRKEIKLVKDGKNWKVTRDEKTARAEGFRVKSLLNIIANLRPERMVSRKEEKWNEYEVGDTTAIKFVAMDGTNEKLSLYIGKQNGSLTYLRLDGEDEVYTVEGYIRSTFDKTFDDWRDKSFLRVEPDKVTKIAFNYPDSGFVAEKKDNAWVIGTEKADSASMQRFLNKLRTKDIYKFEDDFNALAQPDVTVVIEGGTVPPATIKGWRQTFYKWILSSNRQDDVYFADEGPVVVKDIFPSKRELLKSAP